jgi:hypothetical protein
MVLHGADRLWGTVCNLTALASLVSAQPAFGQALTVTAKGVVTPSCSMTSSQAFPAADFNQQGTSSAKALVSCNQFFKIKATSTKGAIKTSTAASGQLVNSLPYSLKVDVPLDNGATATATCAATTLVAGQAGCALSPANSTGLTSGGQIATNKNVALTASWSPPALPQMLVPGSYSDTITLSIATVP